MNPTTLDDYVYLLSLYMLGASYTAQDKNRERKQTVNGNLIELAEGLNPKRMSDKHYYQIVEFYNFLVKYNNLTDKQLEKIINYKHTKKNYWCINNKDFKYLQNLNYKIPNFFNELKTLGPEKFALKIIKRTNISKELY